MALFKPCMKYEFFGPKTFVNGKKVPFWDFNQNVPCPSASKWIKVNKWDYLKNAPQESKKKCLGFIPMNP